MRRLLLEFAGSAALALLAILAALAILERSDPPQQLPLVKADWSVCARLNPNGPVVDQKRTIHGKGHPEFT